MRRYGHVVLIGVDGAGAFIREADTPCFDRIFSEGAKTYSALSSLPSISAECWASMLTGVSPILHGCTNESISSKPYPKDSLYPTVYRCIREQLPETKLAAYCDWEPILKGIIEDGISVDKLSLPDKELTPKCIEYIRANRPDLMFIHMDSVDHAGHHYGYGTAGHLAQIHIADGYIGAIYEACREAGMLEDTLFCVISDHGGTCEPDGNGGFTGDHGGNTEAERRITFAAAGHGTQSGEIGPMNIRDVAAILLYAFGLSVPAFDRRGWTAQIPNGIFKDRNSVYFDIGEEDVPARISREQHASQEI